MCFLCVSCVFQFTCKVDSKLLSNCLSVMNNALLTSVHAHYRDPKNPYPKEENLLLYELTSFLEATGMSNPLTKIYVATAHIEFLPLILFLLVINMISKLVSRPSETKRGWEGWNGGCVWCSPFFF